MLILVFFVWSNDGLHSNIFTEKNSDLKFEETANLNFYFNITKLYD